MSDPVYFVGLDEFVRDLRRVDRQLPRQVAKVMRRAAKTAEASARRRYTSRYKQGTSNRSTRSVKGITAFASSSAAGIKFGGPKRPWLPGQEFGSNKYPQFRGWTGKGPNGQGSWGRFVWPAAREVLDDASDDLIDELLAIYRGAARNG